MAYAFKSRLNPSLREAIQKCQLLKRCALNIESQCRCYAAREAKEENDEIPKPTKFTTSKAHSISAIDARRTATRDDRPWSQTISLMVSLAAFLIYFGILREENDLDEVMESDITRMVPDYKEVSDKMRTRDGRAQGRAAFTQV